MSLELVCLNQSPELSFHLGLADAGGQLLLGVKNWKMRKVRETLKTEKLVASSYGYP